MLAVTSALYRDHPLPFIDQGEKRAHYISLSGRTKRAGVGSYHIASCPPTFLLDEGPLWMILSPSIKIM